MDSSTITTPEQSPRLSSTMSPRSPAKDSLRLCPSPYSQQTASLIWNLPDEILLSLLSFLAIDDLCSVAKTCHRLNYLANSRSVMSRVSFRDFWPEANTAKLYQKAARAGNFEANIKLGVACLYGEGCEASPEVASEMLIRAEQITGSADPFSWLLYRPPWSSDSCSKACIYRDMKQLSSENVDVITKKYCGIMFCVAKTMWLKVGNTDNTEAKRWFEVAAERGCGEAAFELFQMASVAGRNDVSQRLDSIRYLREHGFSQSLNVQIALCDQYAKGYFAGVSPQEAMAYFHAVIKEQSRYIPPEIPCNQKDLDKQGKMRYILVDWLVEVADLKQFSRDTLYMTVSLVDRYLAQHVVTRKTLQLLGIACMVIAARFSENEVITIREAAWLTDNTYTYEKVVRTMGKALCAAHGRLRVSTHLDFLRLFISLSPVDKHTEELMHFVSELVLLHMSVANTSPVDVAAAVYYLTNLCNRTAPGLCWPDVLQQWTHLSVQNIAPTILDIQDRCFQIPAIKDHRGVELQAVNERYERRTGKSVRDFTPMPTSDIHDALATCCDLGLAQSSATYAKGPVAARHSSDSMSPMDTVNSPVSKMDIDASESCRAPATDSGAALSNISNSSNRPQAGRAAKRRSSAMTPVIADDVSL